MAADAYATRLFDKRPDYVPYIKAAAKMGLGTMDLVRPQHQEVRGLTAGETAQTAGSATTTRAAATAARRPARWEPPARGAPDRPFALFVDLLFAGLQRLTPPPYTSVFFRFDPLAAFSTMLAAAPAGRTLPRP